MKTMRSSNLTSPHIALLALAILIAMPAHADDSQAPKAEEAKAAETNASVSKPVAAKATTAEAKPSKSSRTTASAEVIACSTASASELDKQIDSYLDSLRSQVHQQPPAPDTALYEEARIFVPYLLSEDIPTIDLDRECQAHFRDFRDALEKLAAVHGESHVKRRHAVEATDSEIKSWRACLDQVHDSARSPVPDLVPRLEECWNSVKASASKTKD